MSRQLRIPSFFRLPLLSLSLALACSQAQAAELTLSYFQQTVLFTAGVILKPLYMLLCLALILWLWKSRGPLRMLFWALICFEAGEAFCAVDYFIQPTGHWHPVDLLHGAGMVAMGALSSWAIFHILDEHVIGLRNPDQTCALRRFCTVCGRHSNRTCGVQRLFTGFTFMLALLSLMPLCIPLDPVTSSGRIFGTWVDFSSAPGNLFIEHRLYAGAGAASFLVSFCLLLGGQRAIQKAEPFFFLGLGLSGFAAFRFLLHHAFHDFPVWIDFWEELTELMAMAGIALGLWVFRKTLLAPERSRHA